MRSTTRIKPILRLLEEVWWTCPDQRLGQLIENMGVDWNTEDVNSCVIKMCSFAKMDTYKYLLWGTRDKKNNVTYKPLISLETGHLENILKTEKVSPHITEAIEVILKERFDSYE